MPKIAGWKKIEDNKTRLRYGSGKERSIMGHRGKFPENWITLIDNEVYHSGIKKQEQRKFITKSEAKRYMFNYMRRHPNG